MLRRTPTLVNDKNLSVLHGNFVYDARMSNTVYADAYRGIDFRKEPQRYVIGKGEQGVLIAEPYKSEILPYWRFATPEAAEESASTIYAMFLGYKKEHDFVGMDMARKFLQMGFTRSRRYANHSDGNKYNDDGTLKPQAADWQNSPKAQAARIFYGYYLKARDDAEYVEMKKVWPGVVV
jgi:hypothetical protein